MIINTKRSIQTLLMGVTTAVVVIATVTVGTAQADTTYKFVSMPDYWNADVGDVSGSPYYTAGKPNSINDSYRAADDFILGSIQAEGVTDVLSVGDFVEGHWGIDTLNTDIFGPISTTAEKREAVKLAGATYYPQVMDRFTRHGFTLYPGLGDHEIGDNDWNVKKGGMEAFKYNNLSLYKQTYSRYLMQSTPGTFRFKARPTGQATATAYAVRPNPDVQLITLDVFRKTTTGVIPEVDTAQLAWVERNLKRANTDGVKWIIVQGHTPIVSPVRKQYSSGMMYQGGTSSPLWKLMQKYKVDVYLAGEVHDVTGHYVDGIAQISHGGLAYRGNANYLIGEIVGDTLTFTSKQFSGTADWDTGRMWQTDMTKSKPVSITYTSGPVVAGQMQITSNNTLVSRDGNLSPYPTPSL